jgi:hypothetical protein
MDHWANPPPFHPTANEVLEQELDAAANPVVVANDHYFDPAVAVCILHEGQVIASWDPGEQWITQVEAVRYTDMGITHVARCNKCPFWVVTAPVLHAGKVVLRGEWVLYGSPFVHNCPRSDNWG